MRASSPGPKPASSVLKAERDFGLRELRARSGLVIQVLPSGALYAIRHRGTLLNQVLPGPADEGLFRLILKWRDRKGSPRWAPLTGPTVACRVRGRREIEWEGAGAGGVSFRTVLVLHARQPAWSWHVEIGNAGPRLTAEVILSQDLGLGDVGGVRNNEAFNSHYLDLLPVKDRQLGWTILARQNQAAEGGRHPWLAVGCREGAAAFATDATQVFGADHRLTHEPAIVRARRLPSRRLQYEVAVAALQSRPIAVPAGGTGRATFVVRYVPDHPKASHAGDLALLRRAVAEAPGAIPARRRPAAPPAPSLFLTAPWAHGAAPTEPELRSWFGAAHRQVETGPRGEVHAFFCGPDTHVVTRHKEAAIARPHGHILRTGAWQWVDPDQFGTSCYAAGLFSIQAYLGNASIARLLPVVRDPLGIGRAAGQRVFVRLAGGWSQLGVPTVFAMTPGEARWIYRLEERTIEVRTWCSPWIGAAFLELRADRPVEFLVTHTLAMGPNEFEQGAQLRWHRREGWVAARPDPEGVIGSHLPRARFALAYADPGQPAAFGGDEALFPDGVSRGHPAVVIQTGPVGHCGVVLAGTTRGDAALSRLVGLARHEWTSGKAQAAPPAAPLQLAIAGGAAAAVSRLNEILPWLSHNAAIHFSAPHGLEQQGGGAWGVRDVCQGSLEWLLAAGQPAVIRRMLTAVFAQQYARDGSWPQWFMHPPYQAIQQAHSNGDVCLWPVKALCDYLEASNDLGFLQQPIGYTDPVTFQSGGPAETVLQHCDRVIDHCESRFLAGTALINYGDGDWDDTLQPADPAIRTRMISAWTVALLYHTFRQYAVACRRAGEEERRARLEILLARVRADFHRLLILDRTVAGFLITADRGPGRPLLHPRDRLTGIRYRLLPMTRSILAELFTPEAARHHFELVHRHLLYPDGARLMSHPDAYRGGCEHLFKRADTAANVGREIGLQYVHAHLRYAEAMARLGEAELVWRALQVVNPVGLREVLPQAVERQSNVYFSSSDADFPDRVVAARNWPKLHQGTVPVRGGWRLYSSGPGLFLHTVRCSLLGVREHYDEVIFDPVLPKGLDQLVARTRLAGFEVELTYRVRRSFGPLAVKVNGERLTGERREANPYRLGGLCFPLESLQGRLTDGQNRIAIEL